MTSVRSGEARDETVEGAKRELIAHQLCAEREVRLGMAFGGRGVNPAGSNDHSRSRGQRETRDWRTHARTHKRSGQRCARWTGSTHLVEGHLLRYASGLAAASGTSLPHRSNGRISSQGAAGLVVPAAVVAAAAVTADSTGRPEGVLLQGRATAHRDRRRHSRRNVDNDDDDDDGNDEDTRGDRPVWQTISATHIRHGRVATTFSRGESPREHAPPSFTYFFPSLPLTRPRCAALPIRRLAGGIAADLAFLRWAPFARSTFLEPRRITDETGAGDLRSVASLRGRARDRRRRGRGRRGRGHDTRSTGTDAFTRRYRGAWRRDVNRGRDARNHGDRRTDRTIVRDRFSEHCSFYPSSLFPPRAYLYPR